MGIRLKEFRVGRSFRRHFEQCLKLQIQKLNTAPAHTFSHFQVVWYAKASYWESCV